MLLFPDRSELLLSDGSDSYTQDWCFFFFKDTLRAFQESNVGHIPVIGVLTGTRL